MRKMKDSGVEWIGEIPAEWNLIRFRFIADITTGNKDTQDAKEDGKYPFYVRSPIVEHSDSYTFEGPAILMAGDGAGAGRVFHLVDGKYAVHQRVYRFYNIRYALPKFLLYYLENMFGRVMDYGSAKTTVPSVRLPMIQNFHVSVPPLDTQQQITELLTQKDSQINSLIANLQEQIEKLKAYKQSLITEVVTKGLDPNAPMKDSGVEWIGEMPAEWRVWALKYFVDILPGYAFSSDDFDTKNGIPLLRGINVTPNGIRWDDTVYWNKAITEDLKPYILVENDIVVGLDRPWISEGTRITRMTNNDLPALLLQRVCRIRAKDEIDSRWVLLWIASSAFKKSLSTETTGISVPHISTKQVGDFVVTLPTISVQREICDYIDEKCSQIDRLIFLKQSKIEKLEQYKRSLIYEYVTGKKEVS